MLNLKITFGLYFSDESLNTDRAQVGPVHPTLKTAMPAK